MRYVIGISYVFTILFAMLLIWSHRFLPISDYPDWLFEGTILNQMLRGHTFASYSLKHYPVPYTAVVLLLGLLNFLVSPEGAGKMLLSAYVVFFPLSSLYLLTSLQKEHDNPLLIVPLLFTFNTFFFWGEFAYLLGITALFFYCGYLFRRLDQPQALKYSIITLATLILFFCHFIPYAISLLITGIFLLFRSDLRIARRFALAYLPSIILTAWYAIERLFTPSDQPLWQFWRVHQLVGRLIATLSPFPAFLPWVGVQLHVMKFAAIANLTVLLCFLTILPTCLFLWFKNRKESFVLSCSLVCMFFFVAAGYEFSGMVSPGERFLYPAIWMGVCWLVGARVPSRWPLRYALASVIVSVLLLQVFFLQVTVSLVSGKLASFYSELAAARSQVEFCQTYEMYSHESWDRPHRSGFDLLLTNHASAPRIPYYLYVEQNIEPPVFQVSIINYSGLGNNEDLCASKSSAQP